MALFTRLGKYTSTALFIMRVGIGAMMILHGYPKLMGGPDKWASLGGNMTMFGIKSYHEIWGFLAAASEGVGGLLLILGLFFRPACFFMLCTMIVAVAHHLHAGESVKDAAEAIELGFVFMGLFLLGPGKYSIDKS